MALMSRATRTLQWPVQWVAKPRGGANPNKAGLGSDCRLQPACMKLELLVTAGQHHGGEYVLEPCTHSPSRPGSQRRLKAAGQPCQPNGGEAAAQVGGGNRDEVVAR